MNHLPEVGERKREYEKFRKHANKTKEQESGQELVFQEKNNKLPVSLQAIFIYKETQGCG